VERRIDKMLDCDALVDEEEGLNNYDSQKIEQFKQGIEIINNQVYVDLVWHDNLCQVPSNYHVALKALERVCSKLDNMGRLLEYNQGFYDQAKEGQVEEFFCDPKDYNKYKWLTHRPVFKTDAQCTYKMRPVFNCSLKTQKDKPSLNEAAYAGINLMQDMLELQLLFRTEAFVLLGDLKKAFLQIKLKSERDKNCFCFFIKDGDRIRCFRYTTIIFGFISSPFMLNYIVKYIADLYPQDHCNRVRMGYRTQAG